MPYQQVTSIKSLGSGDRVKIRSPFKTKPREKCVKKQATGTVATFSHEGVTIALDKPVEGYEFRTLSALMVSKGYISVKL